MIFVRDSKISWEKITIFHHHFGSEDVVGHFFSESKHRRETSNLSLKEAYGGSRLPKSVTQDVWVGMYAKTRCWFQILFFFTPNQRGDDPI